MKSEKKYNNIKGTIILILIIFFGISIQAQEALSFIAFNSTEDNTGTFITNKTNSSIKPYTNKGLVNIIKSDQSDLTKVPVEKKQDNIIKLSIVNEEFSDQTIIKFQKESTHNLDSDLDAPKLLSDKNKVQLYSFSENNNTKIAINLIPEITNHSNVFIGFKAQNGHYQIVVDELNIPLCNLYLYDKLTKKYTDIIETGIYEFDHTGGEDNTRFKLVKNCSQTNIPINPEIFKQLQVCSPYNGFFSSSIENIDKIEIITIFGHLLIRSELQGGEFTTIQENDLPNGNYFVKFYSNGDLVKSEEILVSQ